jgi:uncharacterized protein (TIGR04551 family)
MSRLHAALAALALVASPLAAAAAEASQPAPPAQPAPKLEELDPKTKAAIDRAIEKAKDDLRAEVRAEIQGAQSAAEFIGATSEGPKLQFLQMDGYYRVRAQLFDNLDLGGRRDASGRYLFPVPFDQPNGAAGSSTLSSANMRLRLEPTMNVSEHVRVRAQIDILDNHVLGSSTSALYDDPGSPYPSSGFYGSSRVVLSGNDPHLERPYISPKRVWGEVQTPVGLLSFGRMPSEWGLGIMSNAGAGLDEDFGDTVDRIQFALPAVSTPIGRLVFVPMLDFDNEGALYRQPFAAPGTGQPFDAEPGDDGRTYGLKIARLDTPDEIRRKLDRNEASTNFGAYYAYRQQRWTYPDWTSQGFDASYASTTQTPASVHRAGYAHVLDLWFRWLSPRWRVEAEVAGVYGSIVDTRSDPNLQPVPPPKTYLQQWGGALVVEYKVAPNKVMIGGEIGAASGDPAPGFGNVPSYGTSPYGSLEGAQYGCIPNPNNPSGPCLSLDRTISNFRFNPAYRVDLVLFHTILGQVTDALYVKPKLRWDILPGLWLDESVIYSRAMEKASTPSVNSYGAGGSANLGIELDTQLNYASGDGFHAWFQWGILQSLAGLDVQGHNGGRAHVLAAGIATKF